LTLFPSSAYAMRKVQANQQRLKWNMTHQLLVSADGVDLLGKDIDTIKKNTEVLLFISKHIGLEANTEKTMFFLYLVNRTQGKITTTKVDNKFF